MLEKGWTMNMLAKEINMDKSILYDKLQDKGDLFLIRDADKITKALTLTKEEASSIFFGHAFACNATNSDHKHVE